jgi:hypothetical protein
VRGDQIVHDEADVAVVYPLGFVVGSAVLEIKDRVGGSPTPIVSRGRIDVGASPFAGQRRVVPELLHDSMRHVLRKIKIDTVLRHLDAASFAI